MPPTDVNMGSPGPIVAVPSTTQVRLVAAGGATPVKWEKNSTADDNWTPIDEWTGASALTFPSVGEDVEYRATDDNGVVSTAVVQWAPNPPPGSLTVTPGPGNVSVKWNAAADEKSFDYYEVDLEPPQTLAGLPRQVKTDAVAPGNSRVVSIEGLPAGFYLAKVKSVRNSSRGPVTSDELRSEKVQVLPAGKPYGLAVRLGLGLVFLLAIAGGVYLLLQNPHHGQKVRLNWWALGTAALFVLAGLAFISLLTRPSSLLNGADNRISTSKVNVALWSVAVAFGILTLSVIAFGAHEYHRVNPCALAKGKAGANVDGICVDGRPVKGAQLALDTTFKDGLAPNYLVLLGTPFAALAGAAFIVNRQVSTDSRQKVDAQGPSRFTDTLTNDNGSADLVDSQYLLFTGVLFFYFLSNFIPKPTALPDLPWSLVGLTGVSAGTYLLNKTVTTNGLSVNGFASSTVKRGATGRILGLNFLPDGSSQFPNGGVTVMLGDRSVPITNVSNTAIEFTADVPEGQYSVQVTTAANVTASAGTLTVTAP